MEYPEYYKCFSGGKREMEDGFTIGKIYKIKNPEDLEKMGNFIDDNGQSNGWGGVNYKHFEPSTIEKWNIQEGIYTKSKVEEDYSSNSFTY